MGGLRWRFLQARRRLLAAASAALLAFAALELSGPEANLGAQAGHDTQNPPQVEPLAGKFAQLKRHI